MPKKLPIFYSALLLTGVNLLLRLVGTSFQVYISGRIGAAGVGLLQLTMSVGSLAMVTGIAGVRTATMYLTAEELGQVSAMVNEAVLEGYDVHTEVLPIEEAKQRGAIALFGEKYGDTVRVVDMGGYSVEFCGGTHLDNTAKAGPFRCLRRSFPSPACAAS